MAAPTITHPQPDPADRIPRAPLTEQPESGSYTDSRGRQRKFRRINRPLSERFWLKVHKTDSCWLWTGHIATTGYGQVGVDGRKVNNAHRVAWELAVGPVPDGEFVLHRCDNRACVNPHHLFLGSARDNLLDCISKGRFRHVPGQSEKKLTLEMRCAIRERANAGEPAAALANEYGVSPVTIRRLVARKTYAGDTGPERQG